MQKMKQFLVLIALVWGVSSKVVEINECSGPEFENLQASCPIQEVRIEPCAEDKKSNGCTLTRGGQYNLEMDFTPDFDGSDVKMVASFMEIPFDDMDPDACGAGYLECPVVKGKKTTFKYNLALNKHYPPGTFNVQWLLTVGNQPRCCFVNVLKIDKKKKS